MTTTTDTSLESALDGWEVYAEGSGAAEAGAPLPADLLQAIQEHRAGLPREPHLQIQGKGHMYTGHTDQAHLAYLQAHLEARAAGASPSDRRKILAFLALQGREGSTAAINTYDNQIVTWGTGWGGRGSLGMVMQRATSHPSVRAALARAGVRYVGHNVYQVVDTATGKVVTGQEPALEVVRASLDLLCLLIHLARSPETRDAATEAQLGAFMAGSASIAGDSAIATQALFNFVAHLKHWAPGYVIGCLEWAAPRAGGSPSAERDRALAVLVTRYFYGKAHTARGARWIPSWKQLLLYAGQMKKDGLDCSGEALFQAPAPPGALDDSPAA